MLFCLRIFIAQKTVRQLVFLDAGEATSGRVEVIVGIVIVALAHFTQQHVAGAGLHGKIVVQPLIDKDALARRQADLRSGKHGIRFSVGVNDNVGFIVDGLIFFGIVDADEHIATAAVDDVLGLVPVEMVRRILTFLQIQKLFGIDLGMVMSEKPSSSNLPRP